MLLFSRWLRATSTSTGRGQRSYCFHHLDDDRNPDSYIHLLKQCARHRALQEGRKIHAKITSLGILQGHLILSNLVVSMYGKCGCLDDARNMFDSMRLRNVFSWTALLSAYAELGRSREAVELLSEMQLEGVKPDEVVFVTVLNACACPEALPEGKLVHALVDIAGFEQDRIISSCLVNMYGKCGDLDGACQMFEQASELRDVVTWNTMLALYHQHGRNKWALQFFFRMEQEGVKGDDVTFITLLYSSAESGLHLTRKIFDRIIEPDVIAWTFIIQVYSEYDDNRGEAIELLRKMQLQGVHPNQVTMVAMLNCCIAAEDLSIGKMIHKRIEELCSRVDLVLGTALVNMYGRCGNLQTAMNVFEKMNEEECGGDVVSWTTMVSLCAQNGDSRTALHLFRTMQQQGVKADNVTLVSVLNACSALPSLAEGKHIHELIVESMVEHIPDVAIALVSFYGRCGNLQLARNVFDTYHHHQHHHHHHHHHHHSRSQRRQLQQMMWTAMVAGYAAHGYRAEALEMFLRMKLEGVACDRVVFLSLLGLCSHAGMVEDACRYFSWMVDDHSVTPSPEHYGCLIDVLGRAGWLAEAQHLMDGGGGGGGAAAAAGDNGNAIKWRSFMSACVSHGDLGQGRCAVERVLQLDPECDGAYVMLSNIHAVAGCGYSKEYSNEYSPK